MGGSLVPAPWVLPAFQGWCHVVSYGYRLAPHAGVEDMAADGADAFAWCRAHLPALLDVDIDAYAVGGLSAGGTLALLNATNLSPRPRAVLDCYGIADFGDTYFDPKFTGPGYDPGTVSGRYSEGELERAIADRNPQHAHTSLAGDEDPDAESTAQILYARLCEMFGAGTDKKALQQDIRVHVAATSRIMRVLTRRERFKDNDSWRAAATACSPIAGVDARFPPTAILHGTVDRVVPVEQSARLAKKLVSLGVEVKEVYAANSDHCFDFELMVSSRVITGRQHDSLRVCARSVSSFDRQRPRHCPGERTPTILLPILTIYIPVPPVPPVPRTVGLF
jgi:acetyl esterase/lipase